MTQAAALAMLCAGFSLPSQAQTCPVPGQWNVGDPFVGVGHGSYLHYTNCGTDSSPNYVLVETISISAFGSDPTAGCAWDSQLNLYLTDTKSGLVAELNGINPGQTGSSSHGVSQTLSTGVGTTSVMFESSGNLYVGLGGVAGSLTAPGLLKYTPTLPPDTPAGSFTYPTNPTTTFNTGINTDWIDLANDQKTLYFTGEGFVVQKEDLSTLAPSTTFSTSVLNQSFAVRLLPPFDGTGGVLLADTTNVVRLDSTGSTVKVYAFPNSTHLQALTLDPNGTSAWVADIKNGNLFRFNISTGTVEFTIATPGGSSPNGLCVRGGPELNVVPLVYQVGTNVSATANFGAPNTLNSHAWSATFDQILQKFVLVVTATEGIDLGRFTEYFPNQAGCGGGSGCIGTPASPATLTPIPYADQVDLAGTTNTQGKAVVYRAANEPVLNTQYSGNIFISTRYHLPPLSSTLGGTGFYTPPSCLLSGTGANTVYTANPRIFRDPASSPPVDAASNHSFAFDATTFSFNGDITIGGTKLNDYNAADRCPTNVGSSATFLSPLPKAKINLGSAVSLGLSVVDASGNPITDAVTAPNNITLSITDQNGVPERVFGVPGNSPNFFKITSNNKYKANLDTTGLEPGQTTLCVTSINTNFTDGIGTATGPGEFPPSCTIIILK